MLTNFLQFCICHKPLFQISRRLCSTVNKWTTRSHTCGELNSNHVGQEVTLCGRKSFHRCDKFVILRDKYGDTQIVFRESENSTKKYINSLPLESVLEVKGTVLKRPSKDFNRKMPTGEIEVEASEVKVLNEASSRTPFTSKDQEKMTDSMKYKYRYLYLRTFLMQENLRIRSEVTNKVRQFLLNNGFVDFETPTLFKRTPGGAKEFVVPTRFPGMFYSLVQSPQQFKQLAMSGGTDRYFQIARCYRNEGTKSDRQPEFTQVDIELSYTTSELIQDLIENLLQFCWPEYKGQVKIPFPKMKYEEAMKLYGTDKPDLRFEVKIQDLTTEFKESNLQLASESKSDSNYVISCILFPRGSKLIKKSVLKELEILAESKNVKFIPIFVKENNSWSSSISKHIESHVKDKIDEKLLSKPEDLILLAAGKSTITQSFLGKARIQCAEFLQSVGVNLMDPNALSFVWITDFPLFIPDENGKLESAHHPFTAPHPDNIDLIYTDPAKVKSEHYDLVLNGQEVGGGSIRVHHALLQKYILENILGEDPTELQHILEGLNFGCPPHGGIALGLDRILAIMCGCRSITDVIPFPKSLDGKDLMSGAPCPISYEDKKLYHIEPVIPDVNKK